MRGIVSRFEEGNISGEESPEENSVEECIASWWCLDSNVITTKLTGISTYHAALF
jgi:hypothetical protein